jgi:hypothetical protein
MHVDPYRGLLCAMRLGRRQSPPDRPDENGPHNKWTCLFDHKVNSRVGPLWDKRVSCEVDGVFSMSCQNKSSRPGG